jgi:hypothetical protein
MVYIYIYIYIHTHIYIYIKYIYIYILEYYLAIKRNKSTDISYNIMKLENIILNFKRPDFGLEMWLKQQSTCVTSTKP